MATKAFQRETHYLRESSGACRRRRAGNAIGSQWEKNDHENHYWFSVIVVVFQGSEPILITVKIRFGNYRNLLTLVCSSPRSAQERGLNSMELWSWTRRLCFYGRKINWFCRMPAVPNLFSFWSFTTPRFTKNDLKISTGQLRRGTPTDFQSSFSRSEPVYSSQWKSGLFYTNLQCSGEPQRGLEQGPCFYYLDSTMYGLSVLIFAYLYISG